MSLPRSARMPQSDPYAEFRTPRKIRELGLHLKVVMRDLRYEADNNRLNFIFSAVAPNGDIKRDSSRYFLPAHDAVVFHKNFHTAFENQVAGEAQCETCGSWHRGYACPDLFPKGSELQQLPEGWVSEYDRSTELDVSVSDAVDWKDPDNAYFYNSFLETKPCEKEQSRLREKAKKWERRLAKLARTHGLGYSLVVMTPNGKLRQCSTHFLRQIQHEMIAFPHFQNVLVHALINDIICERCAAYHTDENCSFRHIDQRVRL